MEATCSSDTEHTIERARARRRCGAPSFGHETPRLWASTPIRAPARCSEQHGVTATGDRDGVPMKLTTPITILAGIRNPRAPGTTTISIGREGEKLSPNKIGMQTGA